MIQTGETATEFGVALNARNVHTWTDEAMSLPDFIKELDTTPSYARPGEKRRLYGKDFPCPVDWSTWLDVSGMIPETMLPKGPNNILKCLPDSVSNEHRTPIDLC
jgi:hypothetical protein